MTQLEEIYSIFHPILSPIGELVIAGGAVRDTLMGRNPKDYDLFILTDKRDGVFVLIAQLLGEALAKNNIPKVDAKIEWHKSEPYLLESVSYKGAELQIMVNFSKDIYELVDGFDWNVSLFGYGKLKSDEYGFYCKEDISNIGHGKYLKLNKLTYPYSTLRRGYRFSERFTMRLDGDTIRLICAEITKKEEERQKAIEDKKSV